MATVRQSAADCAASGGVAPVNHQLAGNSISLNLTAGIQQRRRPRASFDRNIKKKERFAIDQRNVAQRKLIGPLVST